MGKWKFTSYFSQVQVLLGMSIETENESSLIQKRINIWYLQNKKQNNLLVVKFSMVTVWDVSLR